MENIGTDYIVVVGGTNVDIQGFPKDRLILRDSNIGSVKVSLGGVARNIAENITRLGINTKLISIIGDDGYGQIVLEQSGKIGLDLSNTMILKGEPTSVYLSILDENGDMELAISSMDIYERMDIDFIKGYRKLIENSRLCIIDTNLPHDTIAYLVRNFKGVDFFLDTVSTAKTKRVVDLIGNFHTIKPNKIEAEILTGIKIQNQVDLEKAAKILHEKGVKNVFISLGEDGVFYSNGRITGHKKPPKIKIINATGAGDAFLAALAYGYYHNMGIEETAELAIYASVVALSHPDTINPKMSIEEIKLKMEENKL
jgi:pseudouridine kinase